MDKAILRFWGCLSVLALSLLTGCASVRLIDSNVVSVAAFPPGVTTSVLKFQSMSARTCKSWQSPSSWAA